MRRQLLLFPVLFALGLGLVACDDDDGDGDGDLTADEVTGAIGGALRDTRDGATSLADDIDKQIDGANLDKADDKVRENWVVRCEKLSDDAEDEDLGAELTDICGDLRKGLDDNDGPAVEAAGDRLRDVANEIETDAATDDK